MPPVRVCARMADRHRDVALDALRMPQREMPGLHRAPVVPDQPHLPDAERIQYAHQIGDEFLDLEVAGARGNRTVATAARVRRNYAVTRRHQRRDLVAPDGVIVRKPVHQQHVGTVAFDDDVELLAVDGHGAVIEGHGAISSMGRETRRPPVQRRPVVQRV